MNATKNGIKNCPNCKAIDEVILEGAFMEAFGLLAGNFEDVLEVVMEAVESSLTNEEDVHRRQQLDKDISSLESKKSRMTDMLIDGTITKDGGDYPNVGEVKEDAIECLKKMQESYKIALWTCRDGKQLQEALDYLESLGFVPDFVNCQRFTTGSPKMVAHTYIDDAAFPYVAASNTFWTDYWTTLQLLER